VIRNAGGVVTDDEIRSSRSASACSARGDHPHHHTDCGMLTFTDDAFKQSVQDDTGIKPEWGPSRSRTSIRTSAVDRADQCEPVHSA